MVSSTYRTDIDAFFCRHITDKISTFIFLSSEKIDINVCIKMVAVREGEKPKNEINWFYYVPARIDLFVNP